MNYGEAKAQFQAILNRRDITPTLITTFMQQGIRRVQRELRFPGFERGVETTIPVDFTGDLEIPNDFLQIIAITQNNTQLQRKPVTEVLRSQGLIDYARIYCRRLGVFTVAPLPPAGSVIRVDYYADMASISADSDTNTLLEVAPEAVIYGALSYAADYFLDDRTGAFEQRYSQILDQVQAMADLDELSNASIGFAYNYDC